MSSSRLGFLSFLLFFFTDFCNYNLQFYHTLLIYFYHLNLNDGVHDKDYKNFSYHQLIFLLVNFRLLSGKRYNSHGLKAVAGIIKVTTLVLSVKILCTALQCQCCMTSTA